MREISFPVEVIEGVPVVTAPEEIDLANAAGLQAALLETALLETAEPGRAIVVVDMSRTRFCDSAGLNALVGANRRVRAEGGEVRLVIVAEAVARIVALTGVDRVVPIYASLEEALTLGLAGTLHAQGEVGLAFPVDLCVEHLVRQVGSGLRLQVDVRSVCLDDLVVLTRSARGCDLQHSRVCGFGGGGRDPQACPFGSPWRRYKGLDGLGGRFGQHQHACHPFISRPGRSRLTGSWPAPGTPARMFAPPENPGTTISDLEPLPVRRAAKPGRGA